MTVEDDIWKCSEELLMAALATREGKHGAANVHLRNASKYPSHIYKTANDALQEIIRDEKARRKNANIR